MVLLRTFGRRLLVCTFFVMYMASRVGAADGPELRIDAGEIVGVNDWSTQEFLGIPFAAPPVGELRWQSPAAVRPWSGVRDATTLAQPCATEGFGDGKRTTNEDCLYLNVYRPKPANQTAELPVMVFFHGGGNVSGSTTIYDGIRMAEVGRVIVVIATYRLGIFGLAALPDSGTDAGTLLLQDNIAALRWVHRNIAAFGGDPKDVTVSGQSSGGSNVCNLIAAPTAAGLFRQAIVQSGLCTDGPLGTVSLTDLKTATNAAAAKLGCKQSDVAGCLRAKSADQLLDAWPGFMNTASGTPLLPLSAYAAFASGHFTRVPVLIGFTRDEWWAFEHARFPLTEVGLQKAFADEFNGRATEVTKLYPSAKYPHIEYALGAAVGDSLVICPSIKVANALANFTQVRVYEFADRTAPPFKSLGTLQPRPAGYFGGAGHTAELQYLYNYQSAEGPLNSVQRRLGDEMIQRWVGFNRASPSSWPPYKADAPTIVRFGEVGASIDVRTDISQEHHCGFWNK